MKYHELAVKPSKSKKRVGRGIAAGQGKTAGRGTKGQKSRTGYSKRPGFEGGQNPLMQRLPKLRGFRSLKPVVEEIFTKHLDQFAGKTVDAQLLAQSGLVSSAYADIKLLKKGEVTKKVIVNLPAASAGAVAQLEKAGGSFEMTPILKHPASKVPNTEESKTAKPTQA